MIIYQGKSYDTLDKNFPTLAGFSLNVRCINSPAPGNMPRRWFQVSSWTSGRISWQLVRNADSHRVPLASWLRNSGDGVQHLSVNRPPSDSAVYPILAGNVKSVAKSISLLKCSVFPGRILGYVERVPSACSATNTWGEINPVLAFLRAVGIPKEHIHMTELGSWTLDSTTELLRVTDSAKWWVIPGLGDRPGYTGDEGEDRLHAWLRFVCCCNRTPGGGDFES